MEELDPEAAAGKELDQAFVLEPDEGFADGRAADPEPVREVRLAEAGAVAQATVENGVSERQGGVVDESPSLERGYRLSHTRLPVRVSRIQTVAGA